jgi:hypothetical protein
VADGEYGLVEMAEQQHDLWLDRNCQYSMAQFHEDLATKIIWGQLKHLQCGLLTKILGLSGRLGGMSISNR